MIEQIKGNEIRWSDLLAMSIPYRTTTIKLSDKEYVVVSSSSIQVFTESLDQHKQGLEEMGLRVSFFNINGEQTNPVCIYINISGGDNNENNNVLPECGQMFDDEDVITIITTDTKPYYKRKPVTCMRW